MISKIAISKIERCFNSIPIPVLKIFLVFRQFVQIFLRGRGVTENSTTIIIR